MSNNNSSSNNKMKPNCKNSKQYYKKIKCYKILWCYGECNIMGACVNFTFNSKTNSLKNRGQFFCSSFELHTVFSVFMFVFYFCCLLLYHPSYSIHIFFYIGLIMFTCYHFSSSTILLNFIKLSNQVFSNQLLFIEN